MRWELLRPGDWQHFRAERQLNGPATEPTPPTACFALEEAPAPAWIGPPGDQTEIVPVGFVSEAELRTPAFWRQVLRQHPRHTVDLAAYNAGPGANIPAEVFLNALGMRADYRARDEWRSLGELGADARDLARAYDFPISVLRLWDRLESAHRAAWRELWEARVFKKNFIREIIVDFYDLDPADRNAVLVRAQEFSARWRARSGIFPADTIRDQVRARRFPRFDATRAAAENLRQELNLPRGVRLHLPPDLEATHLRLEIEFQSVADLTDRLGILSLERQETIRKILDLI